MCISLYVGFIFSHSQTVDFAYWQVEHLFVSIHATISYPHDITLLQSAVSDETHTY